MDQSAGGVRRRPGEPRFGLDIQRTGDLAAWNDLAWPDLLRGSGSGKSTVARAVVGLAPVTAGAVLLDLVQLSPDLAEVLPVACPAGQHQRIVLARVLAVQPRGLIADEVTSALDVSVQGAVLNLLRTLHRELGFGMLFTHNDCWRPPRRFPRRGGRTDTYRYASR